MTNRREAGRSRATFGTRREAAAVRLQELVVRMAGDELVLRFHERLTVVSGIATGERRELVELLLGALTGTGGQETELCYVDALGEQVRVRSDGHGHVERIDGDGRVVADLAAVLGL